MKLTWNMQFHALLKNKPENPIVLAVANSKIHVCSKRSKVGDIWGNGGLLFHFILSKIVALHFVSSYNMRICLYWIAIYIYVVVSFLSQVIFAFLLFQLH